MISIITVNVNNNSRNVLFLKRETYTYPHRWYVSFIIKATPGQFCYGRAKVCVSLATETIVRAELLLSPGFKQTYREMMKTFCVQGIAMSPSLVVGETVLARLIDRTEWNLIVDFQACVLITEDKQSIRRLYKLTNNEFVSLSDGDNGRSQERMSHDSIKEIWQITAKTGLEPFMKIQ